MAVRKAPKKRAPIRYKRRVFRKIPRRLLPKNNIKSPYLKILQHTFADVSATLNVANPVYYQALTFNLSSILDYQKFTNMFERYRIDGVMVSFYPPATSYNGPQGSAGTGQTWGNFIPTLYMYADYDDATVPTNIAQFLARPNLKTKQWSKPTSYKLVPKAQIAGAYYKSRQWIDSATPAQLHYALKYAIDTQYVLAGVDQIIYCFSVKVTYILSFKGVKYSTET